MKRNASAALDTADGAVGEVVVKRPKKKTNVWSKSTTRKTSRKSKPVKIPSGEKKEECIEVNPAQRFSLEEKNGIQLSKVSLVHFSAVFLIFFYRYFSKYTTGCLKARMLPAFRL